MQIVVATHNEGKLVEIRRILEEDLGADAENIELVSAGSLHLPDPVETGVTFQENALLKALWPSVPVCPLSRMIQVLSSM